MASKRAKLSKNFPIVLSGNKLIWSSDGCNIDINLKRVILGKNECSFSIDRNRDWEIHFSSAGTSFELWGKIVSVENPEIPHFCWRATKLCQHCMSLDGNRPVEFIQVTRDARVGESPDSDDEQIENPPIPKAFSDREVILIDGISIELFDSFVEAKEKSFQNHAAKVFFSDLGKFIMSVLPVSREGGIRMKSYHSTNPKGDAQPGACDLFMSHPTLHNTRAGQDTSIYTKRMVADYVLYDRMKKICCVVGEVKSDKEDDAEQQNVYQMLACFRENQTAMLGFTANCANIYPRLLLRHGSKLELYIITNNEVIECMFHSFLGSTVCASWVHYYFRCGGRKL